MNYTPRILGASRRLAGSVRSKLRVARIAWLCVRVGRNPANAPALLRIGDLMTETRAFEMALARIESDPDAAELVRERYSPGHPPLAQLRAMPPNTLGASFARHLDHNGLTPYPHRSLVTESKPVYVRERVRQFHDILHVVLGYGIDVGEEAQLSGFVAARAATPISVLIMVGGIVSTLFMQPAALPAAMKCAFEGWQRGQEMRSPFAIRWEDHWDRPLEEVRALLVRNVAGPGPEFATDPLLRGT